MRATPSIVRHAFRLVCLCVLLHPQLAAGAPASIAADFDGDGRHDSVTVDRLDPRLLHVWLSTSGSATLIHNLSDVTGLAALDLDGDHRPELVAATQASGLQVWAHDRAGFDRFSARRRPAPVGLSRQARDGMNDDPAEGDGDEASAEAGAAATLPLWLAAPPTARTCSAPFGLTSSATISSPRRLGRRSPRAHRRSPASSLELSARPARRPRAALPDLRRRALQAGTASW
jgi:hypothetical protein